MFVVCRIQDFEFESPLPIPIKVNMGKMLGYLPIYATREDALTDFPNAQLAEIREVEKK